MNANSVARGKTILHPFDYDGVRLLPGRMLDQVENARVIYGAIQNDDILKGFRRNAGLRRLATACAAGARTPRA